MISVTGSIPASELIVVGGDLNGHIGTNVDGYDGVHSGYGFEERSADGEWLLEFCDALELIVANTCFKRRNNTLVTYVSGSTVSTLTTCYSGDVMDELKEMWKSLLEKSVSERLLLVGDVINGGTEKDKKVNYCK